MITLKESILSDNGIKESILSDMDDTLSMSNDAAEAALNGYVPTINDFESNPYNRRMYVISWYCPNLLNVYRSKYSELLKDYTTIQLTIDATYARTVDCHMYFSEKPTPISKRKTVYGWEDGFVGSNLRTYKRMAVSIINKIANNHNKLEDLLKWAMKYRNELRKMNAVNDWHAPSWFHTKSLSNDL